MALSHLLKLKKFPYDVMELRLENEEAIELLGAGYDPTGFTTGTALARFWQMSVRVIRSSLSQRDIPRVQVGTRYYYPIVESLRVYQPKKLEEQQRELMLTTLGQVDSSIGAQITTLVNAKRQLELGEVSSPALQIAERVTTARRTQADYLRALADEVTIEDWRDIIRTAVEQAVDGDSRAREWLGSYLIGRPIQRIAALIDDVSQRFSPEQRRNAILALIVGDEDSNVIGSTA